jgi:hypothetical protein
LGFSGVPITAEGDVVALDEEDGGAVTTPTDLNELAGDDDRVVLDRGAVMPPTLVDVDPPPRNCASATIVDETKATAVTTTRGIS